MLSAGYEYQRIDVNSPTWGGLPRWNTDAAATVTIAHAVPHPDWASTIKRSTRSLRLKQRFADTWQATLNATHSEVELTAK